VKDHISQAYKNFAHLKKDDTSQDTWIAQLIAAQASAWNQTKKALWWQLRSTERIQKTASNVRGALNEVIMHRPLSVILAPSADGNRREFHQKANMEKACLEEAGRRFTQAQHMPFLTAPLIDIFDETGRPKAIQTVMDGSFIPPDQCDPYAAKFLSSLSCPALITNIPSRSLEEYTGRWQKSRETTSLLASGIHFGHYIAGTFNPEILFVNATLADIPLQVGFSYNCWKKGLNIMIEKTVRDLMWRSFALFCYSKLISMPTTSGLDVQSCTKQKMQKRWPTNNSVAESSSQQFSNA